MRINSDIVKPGTEKVQQPGAEAASRAGQPKSEAAVQAGSHASVSLSGKAQMVSRLVAAATDAEEIGAERVAELREQIQQGKYQIDFMGLAARFMAQTPGSDIA